VSLLELFVIDPDVGIWIVCALYPFLSFKAARAEGLFCVVSTVLANEDVKIAVVIVERTAATIAARAGHFGRWAGLRRGT
jgi:hypothetical protein